LGKLRGTATTIDNRNFAPYLYLKWGGRPIWYHRLFEFSIFYRRLHACITNENYYRFRSYQLTLSFFKPFSITAVIYCKWHSYIIGSTKSKTCSVFKKYIPSTLCSADVFLQNKICE
jgi:hypothetical protein